jgi:hypothetical protein
MDTNNLLEVKAALQIGRPAHDVFESEYMVIFVNQDLLKYK